MNDIIKQMIDGYVNAFDTYTISNEALRSQVEDLKSKLIQLGNSTSDPAAFYPALMESGLQEEYSNLISKVAMASMATSQSQDQTQQQTDTSEIKLPTVKEFLEQYRASYNEVCKAEYRVRGKAAYETLFDVANRTDDMLEAQIIIEKERLLWKIVSEDSLDIFETIYEAMDPLYEATSAPVGLQVEIYKKATSEEELTYLQEMSEIPRIYLSSRGQTKINMVALLALQLILYCKSKNTVWEWYNDKSASGGVAAMVACRESIRRILKYIKLHFNKNFDEILQDESWKIWLLNPESCDKFARIKTALSPHNYEVFRDVVNNEILPNISIVDVLKRPIGENNIWLDFNKKDIYEGKAQKKAEELNSHLTYYKYMKQLDTAYSNSIDVK